MREVEIPDLPPLVNQDIDIMRCTTCSAILPGTGGITRKLNQIGIDHYLEQHLADMVADRVPREPIVNCTIQDPFWFEEHARTPGDTGEATTSDAPTGGED